MLKLMRKGAIENVWFYRMIMILISVAFIITMGWWGFQKAPEQRAVAEVGGVAITLQDYQRAYDNAYRFYQDLFQDQFNEDTIKQLDLKNTVINTLVEKELWLMASREMQVTVTDEELSDFILQQRAFYRGDRFDPEIYRRVLARNRFTPKVYEELQRQDLTVQKVKDLLKASVKVTGAERGAIQKQDASANANQPEAEKNREETLLARKQQMALQTYLDSLKSQTSISINERLL